MVDVMGPEGGAPAAGALWTRIVGTLAGVFLGGVFLFAVYLKMFDPAEFAEAIRAQDLEFTLLGWSVSADLMAILALGLESAVGAALVLNLRRWWALIPTGALIAFFLFLLGRAYLLYTRGELSATTSCGCFGDLGDATPAEAFWRDVALLLPAYALCWLGRPRAPFPVVRVLVVAVLALAVAAFAAKAPDLPLDDFATDLKPGLELEDLCVGEGDDRFCLLGDEGAPGLKEGRWIVILADLKDEAFADLVLERLDQLYELSGEGDILGIQLLHAGKSDDEYAFKFRSGEPPLTYCPVPGPLLRPLYRTLPRTFVVVDGRVTRTFSGLPTLGELRSP
jgi:hypothetical protein